MQNLPMKIFLIRNRISRQHFRRDVAEVIEPLQQSINLAPRLRQRPPHLHRDVRRNRLAVCFKITQRCPHSFYTIRQRHATPVNECSLRTRGSLRECLETQLLPFAKGLTGKRIECGDRH